MKSIILNDRHLKMNRIVKESLFEKFTEDSDPISDMEIGVKSQIKKFVKEKEPIYVNIEEDWLWICIDYGKNEFAKYLINKGWDIHKHDDRAFRWACFHGNTEMVKLLLDKGADVHAWNDDSLQHASAKGHKKVVKLLLNAGANVHAEEDAPLKNAEARNHKEIVKILKDHIAKENKGVVKESLLEKFIEDSDPIKDMGIGMTYQIEKFIKQSDVDSQFKRSKKNWIWICAAYRKIEFVKFLIENGANVHIDDDWALRVASHFGYKKIVDMLLKAGADVHADEDYALRMASENGHKEVVELLLKYGADVHALNGWALQWASINGHKDVVKLLQDHIAKEKKEKKRNKRKIKKSLLEKFTEDSDPISDMGIGNGINLYDKAIQILGGERSYDSTLMIKWIDYFESFEGKTVYGYFMKYEGANEKVFKKLDIQRIDSFCSEKEERSMYVVTPENEKYYMCRDEKYVFI